MAHELLRLRVDEDVAWSDMAVLLRSVRGNGEPITGALAAAGIPFVVAGMNNLFGTAEAEAARQLFYFMVGRVNEKELKTAWEQASTGSSDGIIISRIAARVSISTARP